MEKMKQWSIPILLVYVTFFEQGCTTTQRQELMTEALDATKQYITTNVIPQVSTMIEAKLKAKEQEKLKELDAQLALFKTVDDEGNITVKTWKDFDVDRNDELDPIELAKVGGFVTSELTKKVANKEISKDEASKIAKGTGVTLTALLLLLLGKRGLNKVVAKKADAASGAPKV